MDEPIGKKPQSPIQRHEKIDITKDAPYGSKSQLAHGVNADTRSPASMMREMGFDPVKYMTPLQFLVAVLNDDTDLVFGRAPEMKKNRYKSKGIGISYRIQAAKTAAKYFHMEMPKIEYHASADEEFGRGLANEIRKGEHRVRTKRVILETVERLSPDMPLPQASYPPGFEDLDGKTVTFRDVPDDMIDYGDLPPAEGDMDYDPNTDA